ncbi:hypothetical protein EDC04DRAFT_2874145 [Pisolithus marmoratus]|nr:hypothetical protein EDC04DRAFT_2874145 [Pisolithus marmoratus]
MDLYWGTSSNIFKETEKDELKCCGGQWSPFQSEEEWDLAHLLMKNVGQTKINEFLKLLLVHQSGVTFSSVCTFLKCVDSLQTGPAWTCEMIDVMGDIATEDGNMDPVECIMELIGNLAFQDTMAYIPEHAYVDSKGMNCIYDEMWTVDWWLQGKLPEGAMVAPVILLSDKTSLSVFGGDKKAWPMYMTIGNVSKDLKGFQKKMCSLAGYCLFHHTMSLLLQPLGDASHNGKAMICANGCLCQVHPILAAYVTNFPGQCLVACNKESRCLHCLDYPWHSMADTLKMLKFDDEDLPFTNIFTCITPNFSISFTRGIVGEKEIDACFQVMSRFPGLCDFAKGILMVSQVFVGLLSGTVDDHVLVVIHSLLDFIYFAQCQQHMDLSLKAMEESLKTFHIHKYILIDLQIHSLQHYVSSIQALGSADGYNTEYPDNKHDYVEQMALWLQWQEAIHHKSVYLTWRQLRTLLGVDSVDGITTNVGESNSISDPGEILGNSHYQVGHYKGRVTVDQICTDYKAPNFIKQFLSSSSGQCHPQHHDHCQHYQGHDKGMHRAQATPMIAAHGHKPESPARFDTMFVLEDSHQHTEALVLNTCMPVIFKLPDYLGEHPHPLVYVEWLTALCHKDPVSSLYVVNRSMCHHCPNVLIISADHIVQLCHLQAQCGKYISADLSSYSVLEQAMHFYVNSYIDLDMFTAFE